MIHQHPDPDTAVVAHGNTALPVRAARPLVGAGPRAVQAHVHRRTALVAAAEFEHRRLRAVRRGAQRQLRRPARGQQYVDLQVLLIAASEGNPDLERQAIERLLEQRVEGLILATSVHTRTRLPSVIGDVPTVLVHAEDSDGRAPSVLPDERAGGLVATRRLLDAGHRRIGVINLEAGTPAAEGRLAGYREALDAHGVAHDPALVLHTRGHADHGYEAAARLLDLDDAPTALFCTTDRLAMGAYDAIKECGLRIPDDVAVVGFDDQELIAAYLRPKLTTVALPFAAMGTLAVQLLNDLIEGREVPPQTLVGCPLVERASV